MRSRLRSRRFARILLPVLGVGAALGAAAASGVFTGAFGSWLRWRETPPDRVDLSELVAAVGAERVRPTRGRLSGGFAYAPAPAATRGSSTPAASLSVKLAVVKIEQLAQQRPAAATLAAAGIALLAIGDLDGAIASLERAGADSPDLASIHSDLAAAYLARAEVANRAHDTVKALAAAERAFVLAPRSAEAAFNRALALQRVGLVAPARNAWTHFLTIEPDAAWRGEVDDALRSQPFNRAPIQADRVIQDLRLALTRQDEAAVARLCLESPYVVRRYLEEGLFAEWAEVSLAGSAVAARERLEAARMLAVRIGETVHDDVVVRASARITEAVRNGDRNAVRALAEGHRAYTAARRFDASSAQSDAIAAYRLALQAFEHGRSPMAAWAQFWIGVFESRNSEPDQSVRTLEDAIRRGGDGARPLVGRARYVQGLVRRTQGRYPDALQRLTEAIERLEGTGEIELAAEPRTALAEAFEATGQPERAWQLRLRSLDDQTFMHSERDRHLVLIDAVRAAIAQNLPEASLALVAEAETNARTWKHPGSQLEVELARADSLRLLQRAEEALSAIARAKEFLRDLPDQTLAARWDHVIAATEARVLLAGEPARAVAAAERGIGTLSDLGMAGEQPELYGLAAAALVALERLPDADVMLQRGITLVEAERLRLADDELRVTSFDAAYDLYLERAEILGPHLRRWDHCFETLERARTVSTLGAGARVVAIGDLQRELPAGTVVLYLALLKTRAVAWVIAREQSQVVELGGAPDALAAAVRQLLEALSLRRSRDVIASSTAAYTSILGPLRSSLGRSQSLVIIPDGVLGVVPFALLRDPQSGRLLIEDYVVSVAPSATWLRTALRERRAPEAAAPGQALFVAAATDPSGLRPALPAARREIAESSRHYAGARVLIDQQATPEAVLASLPSAALVHIAGHAIASPDSPWLSFLALRPNRAGQSEVFMYQIADLRLRPGAVVVLSACDTAAGTISRSAGIVGLSWGFLSAGAQSVIGTLWNVEDAAAASLMIAFHRRYAAAPDAVSALRAAQLEARAQADSYEWAAFQAIGVSVNHEKGHGEP